MDELSDEDRHTVARARAGGDGEADAGALIKGAVRRQNVNLKGVHYSSLFLLIYSFLGWAAEAGYYAVTRRRFCNRGVVALPLVLAYGISSTPASSTGWMIR